MKKILYVSGTRADFGLMRNTLKAIDAHPAFELYIAATGMHMMERHGYTLKEIQAEGFSVFPLESVFEHDDRAAMAAFIGAFLTQLTQLCRELKPDLILLLGDRGEMLAGAIAATYCGIPAAHIHGGEVTSTVDESARHAITKLSHLHFAATLDSATRIVKMGENPNHVFIVGGPGLDGIHKGLMSEQETRAHFGLPATGKIALLVQHPVSEEIDQAGQHIQASLEALKEIGIDSVIAYPNADAGGMKMIEMIETYRSHPQFHIFNHIPRPAYLSLLRHADVMIGNSSSGIIEAPSFQLAVVNVGSRQEGRWRGQNVIEVSYRQEDIFAGIQKALFDTAFLSKLQASTNPYGDGRSTERIIQHLLDIEINSHLLQKKIQY